MNGGKLLPREKLLTRGAVTLSDEELLAILLRTGLPGISVVEFARQLLLSFGGLRGLADATPESLLACPGIGVARCSELSAALELSRRVLESRLKRGVRVSDPDVARQYLQSRMRTYEREVFACLFLDNQHRLLRYEELFFGTIDGASVHPREVVKRALALNAAAVIFAHNHPSGVAEPSQADRRITARLTEALSLVDVRVLDHMIVGDGEVSSFAESGLL